MITLLLIIICLSLSGCGVSDTNVSVDTASSFSYEDIEFNKIENEYAIGFSIEESDKGYYRIFSKDREYLIVPKDLDIPMGLSEDIYVIRQNPENIVNFSSSTMDFFVALDTLGSVSMTGTKDSDWAIPEVTKAMKSKKLSYIGKYSAPDYELLREKEPELAIFNTMIFHSPKSLELIEDMGIPAFIEYSSYENHPLGRMEWIKVYGLICGKFDEACEVFNNEASVVKSVSNEIKDVSVAFFYISSNGYAMIRKPGDYVSKMIELAGGEYAFKNVSVEGDDENMLSTMRLEMERFFVEGNDADIIVYNSTVDGRINSISELTDKAGILKDFRAVKENRAFCTDSNVFQGTMSIGKMIEDFSKIIENPDVSDNELNYIYRLKQ